MRTLFWLPLLALTAGCWSPRYFAPREHQNAAGPDGDPAAVYVVAGHDGAANGEVRVWSAGSRARYLPDDTEVVDLHVGFELENNGKEALQLDVGGIACEELFVDGVLQSPLAAEQTGGSGYAAPGSTARVDAVFRPPTTVPRRVDSFAVRFAVRAGDDEVLRQVTPFAPTRYVSRTFYDPYWGWGWGPYGGFGPWGYGVGWGYYGGWGWGGPWPYHGRRFRR